MDERAALLEGVPLFAGLEREALERIARVAKTVDVPAGTILTREGRHEGYFYVLVSGTVRVERDGSVVDTIEAGGFFGEIALVDDGPRTATTTTATDCRLLQLTNRQFEELQEESPDLRDALMAAMEHRLRHMDEAGGHGH